MNISISRDGLEIGEWPEAEVRDFYKEGRLLDTDCYWMEGMTEWTPLTRLIRPSPPFPVTTPQISVPKVRVEAPPVARRPMTSLQPSEAISDQPKYAGIGRIVFLCLALTIAMAESVIKIVTHTPPAVTFNPIDIGIFLVLLGPIAARLINMGYSGWYSLLYFVPLVGSILFCFCLLIPPGYAITKKVDAGTRIGFVVGVALFVCMTAISVLILLGTPIKGPVAIDNAEAASYRVSATGGDVVAARKLGLLYLVGLGVPKDLTEALKWLQIAADQGDAVAQNAIGYMYQNGQGVKKDDGQASSWYQKAADQGLALAQYNIGAMYENGQGVARDTTIAVDWYKKAAAQHQSDAQAALKRLEQLGISQ